MARAEARTAGERWTRDQLEALRARPFQPAGRRALPGRLPAAGGRGALARWAATGLMLDWHVGMVDTQDGRPRNLGAADAHRPRPGGPGGRDALAAVAGAVRTGGLGRGAAAAEGVRLAAGVGYATWVYFGSAAAPDPRVSRAARQATPVRVAGLVAAGLGRRDLAGALVAAGAAWSAGQVARVLRPAPAAFTPAPLEP